MADNAARSETSMYCHACHYQWERQGENIECPSCHSASTEIVCGSPDTFLFLTDLEFGLGLTSFDQITPENDPNQFYNRQPEQPITSDSTPNAAPAPAADPAATQTAPQPEQHSNQTTENSTQNSGQPSGNGQIPHSTVQFTVFNLPISGMAFFTTRPIASPASAAGQAEPQPHQTQQAEQPQQPQQAPSAPIFHMPPVIHLSFPIIMHGLPPRRPQTSEAPQQQSQQETRQATVEPQQNNGEQPPVNAEQPQLNGDQQHPSPQPPNAEARDPHRPVVEANMIEALLSMLFNPVNAVLGNAVYSQEAFDRILSQLREQAPAGGAPPASQEAIGKLALRELEHDSKCVVCVEDMPKGEKVAVLPCNHSFHGECVTPWLKLHNTCPVCRRSIEVEETDTVKKAPPVVFGPAPPPGMTQAQQHNGDAMDCS